MPYNKLTAAEMSQMAFYDYAKRISSTSTERIGLVSTVILPSPKLSEWKRREFAKLIKEFDTSESDYHYFKYTEEFGLGIYARKFIPAGTLLRLSGVIGDQVSNKKNNLSHNPHSSYKSIFSIPCHRENANFIQNHILLGTVATANYGCAKHANIIASYNDEPKDYWKKITTIKNINENEQLFINYNIENSNLCCFTGTHRCYYFAYELTQFDQIIADAELRRKAEQQREERTARKRRYSET